jgi:tetratricopeptide (TPR) repeat protein
MRVVSNAMFATPQKEAEKLLGGIPHAQTSRILQALASKNYTVYTQILQENMQAPNEKKSMDPLLAALVQAEQTYITLKEAPVYYHTGLIAATLMQAGYVPYAQALAHDVISQDPSYALGYEILSQAALKQQKYSEALTYLQKLFVVDKQNAQRTSFFMGVAHYFLGDYDQALLSLQQISENAYLYDAQRYMILSFYHQ